MKKLILLCLVSLTHHTMAQAKQSYDFETIKQGIIILAKQFSAQDKLHEAKILAQFLYNTDKNNPDVQALVAALKKDDSVRVYTEMADKGMQFHRYIEGFTRTLKRPDYVRSMSIVATAINPDSNLQRNVKEKDLIYTNKYYIGLFPESEEVSRPANNYTATSAAKRIIIKQLNYNPANFIQGINSVNYLLKDTGVQVEFDEDRMDNIKDIFSSRDDSRGYTIFRGITDPKAARKSIYIKNMLVYDFLRYLQFTTRLTFDLDDDDNIIYLSEAQRGQDGLPEFVRYSSTLSRDIRTSPTNANQKFGNKKVQIIGRITAYANEDRFFLIQLDKFFIVRIDKTRLKDNSQETIIKYAQEYAKTKNNLLLKHTIVAVRGTLKITNSRNATIENCTDVLATENAYFYTK